jgi:arsenate reductase (thioredoxin)
MKLIRNDPSQCVMFNPYLNVLFLCTHNSSRSDLAEALLNDIGGEKFEAFSAGSSPREHQQPNRFAPQTLQCAGINIAPVSSKGWAVFAFAVSVDQIR